jgi:hypothetical protein
VTPLLIALGIPAAAIMVGFVLWRLILWNGFTRIGPWPLAFAYIVFVSALLASQIIIGGFDRGLYVFFLILPFALLAVAVIGVPAAALLARANMLTYEVAVGLLIFDVICAASFLLAPVFIFPASSAFSFGLVRSIAWQERQLARLKHGRVNSSSS